MTAPTARPRFLVDQSVMLQYWLNRVVKARIDSLGVVGTLCSSMVTMDEARCSARSNDDLAFLTNLYSTRFFWLPFDETAEQYAQRHRFPHAAARGSRTPSATHRLVSAGQSERVMADCAYSNSPG
ncbi:MAG TPA: hypothetical protein VFQ37_07260 [Mycobacterium sp.]|nr:hypothetical protein [Mycobacterium sp.]